MVLPLRFVRMLTPWEPELQVSFSMIYVLLRTSHCANQNNPTYVRTYCSLKQHLKDFKLYGTVDQSPCTAGRRR